MIMIRSIVRPEKVDDVLAALIIVRMANSLSLSLTTVSNISLGISS